MVAFKRIFVHCSGTDYGSAIEFDQWHKAKGWGGIGYHFVVSNGVANPDQKVPWASAIGSIETGRHLDDDTDCESDEVGAHVYGFNTGSVGICLVGEYQFSQVQIVRLRYLIQEVQRKLNIPEDAIFGHYEAGRLNKKYATKKTCPNMPMDQFRLFMKDKLTLHDYMASVRKHVNQLKSS